MKVLFYSSDKKEAGKRFKGVIENLVPAKNREIYRTIKHLSLRLRRPTYDLGIAIILTASKEELLEILSIRDLLRHMRIILILPDRKETTISKGHTLYPRFLSYMDSDFEEVGAVLAKMLKNMDSKGDKPFTD